VERDSFDPRLICVHAWEDGRVLYVHMHDRSDSLIDACSISGHMHEAQPPSPPDDQMLLINVLLSDSNYCYPKEKRISGHASVSLANQHCMWQPRGERRPRGHVFPHVKRLRL